MQRNPNHRFRPQVAHVGKTVRIDAPEHQLRDEDQAWIRSLGGTVETEPAGTVVITYPSRRSAEAAFAGMAQEGRCNVGCVRGMVFVDEESVRLAESLGS